MCTPRLNSLKTSGLVPAEKGVSGREQSELLIYMTLDKNASFKSTFFYVISEKNASFKLY